MILDCKSLLKRYLKTVINSWIWTSRCIRLKPYSCILPFVQGERKYGDRKCGDRKCGDLIGWGPFVHGDRIFGDRLSLGTKLVGDRLSRGTNLLGTVCPGGLEVGDRKWGTGSPGIKSVRDQLGRSRLSTRGGEGVEIGQNLVHVVVECPLKCYVDNRRADRES